MALISFFLLILAAVVLIPQYVLILLVLNLCAGLFLSIFQLVSAFLPHFIPKQKRMKTEPFVSILVPAYNEPPAILMQTLEKLSHLAYQNYEVLVIDNNTKDEAVWKPVENFVRTLGNKFRFFHQEPLSGFKAGALNYLLQRTRPESEYIAVIDADYLVKSHFLVTALGYFTEKDIALVQFPQYYRNAMKGNRPIADEYRHFFGIYMNMANTLDCVTSTGTVSMYKQEALKKINGFRGGSLTEDADVGLRLYGAGYRGIYVDRPIGYGLMPYDLEAYRKQKWRWAFGNAQSLKTLILLYGKIPLRSWLGFFSHLTAWHHLHFLPFAALAAFPILLYPAITITPIHREILVVASLTFLVTMGSKMVLFFITFHKQKQTLSRTLRAFVIHMGMTLIYSEAWFAFIFRSKSVFERTNKYILDRMPSLIKNTYAEMILGAWFLLGAGIAFRWGEPALVAVFLLAAFALFSIYYVYFKILPTKAYSKKLMSPIERKYMPYLLKVVPLSKA